MGSVGREPALGRSPHHLAHPDSIAGCRSKSSCYQACRTVSKPSGGTRTTSFRQSIMCIVSCLQCSRPSRSWSVSLPPQIISISMWQGALTLVSKRVLCSVENENRMILTLSPASKRQKQITPCPWPSPLFGTSENCGGGGG